MDRYAASRVTGMSTGSHFCRRWEAGSTPTVPDLPGVALREVDEADTPDLGWVMWSAFQGSGDDEYETVTDAEIEVRQTLAGKWGSLVANASLVALIGRDIVSAVLIVLDAAHDQTPLLAFAVTIPEHQRKGLGGWLIENAVRRLDALGVTELHLAVLPGNPARRLYERLAFELVAGS
jgi:GNAT superfamily N-acetyltransferase